MDQFEGKVVGKDLYLGMVFEKGLFEEMVAEMDLFEGMVVGKDLCVGMVFEKG